MVSRRSSSSSLQAQKHGASDLVRGFPAHAKTSAVMQQQQTVTIHTDLGRLGCAWNPNRKARVRISSHRCHPDAKAPSN